MTRKKRGVSKQEPKCRLSLVLHVNISKISTGSTICWELSHNTCPVHFIDGYVVSKGRKFA